MGLIEWVPVVPRLCGPAQRVPDLMEVAELMEALAGRVHRWLVETNGDSQVQAVLRCTKVSEELGELCAAHLAGDRPAAAREAFDVVMAALVAQAGLGLAPQVGQIPDSEGDSGDFRSPALLLSIDAGRVAEAVIGWVGQNPRKGVTHRREDVHVELGRVAGRALALLAILDREVFSLVTGMIEKIDARISRGQ